MTRGIDTARLEPWLIDAIPTASPPMTFDLVAAGGSNLTYLAVDGNGATWVVRRPPEGRR
ncbi:MAG: phosphotransferase family protein, partial [Acidimicrobiales bacterium]|nr:phosphotransferase family protein [Acidimicrobiales bacterium]